ncbi:MAG TPA: SPOR domain-containing protein [Bryobacteraceae bacterium]|nr:SPOR domain-containing protein [Bryobacteraceae bacterium]
MPKNENGEFELILGNRQLLSVFFIVVVLLGVFFTMGYIVGRNSTPLSAEARAGSRESKPLEVESARPLPSQPASASQAVAPAAKSAAEDSKQADADASSSKAATPEQAKAESASPTPEEPAPGQTYLQVAAVQRAEAELFVDVLAKKGFHALYTPVPDKPSSYRVLVGPFKDPSAIAQARTDLQKAGFKGFEALVRKY